MVLAGLDWLATADVASMPVSVHAAVLRGLEQATSVQTAARSRVLSAFTAQAGYENDGQGSPRTWLTWQTRVTGAAASATVGWARRLRAHPAVGDALAARQITQSWARQVCDWTDQLPEDARGDADLILLAAAAGGAGLDDLASLADQIRRRVAPPDTDGDDGFDDRRVWLSTTFEGAGTLRGDLTPQCAAALRAVLDALGKKADRSDLRSKAQRDHDALQEALTRLIAADCLPDRAGLPTTILLHADLDDLIDRAATDTRPDSGPDEHADPDEHGDQAGTRGPGGPRGVTSDAGGDDDAVGDDVADRPGGPGPAGDSSWPGGTGTTGPAGDGLGVITRPAWPGPAARPGDLCDARIIPIVTGRVDHDLLDRLSASLAAQLGIGNHDDPGGNPPGLSPGTGPPDPGRSTSLGTGPPSLGSDTSPRPSPGLGTGPPRPGTGPPGHGSAPVTRADLRELLLRHSVALLSGPGGLASLLRTGTLPRPAGSVSLPLDVGTATDTIPPHLRRAVIARDKHCGAPGCRQPPAACDVHHIIPRSRGGPTSLTHMILLCHFHHYIFVHQWGWTITLNADGTTTAISPDRTRQYHSHAPPTAAA
jgi:Domain of unknown function (DUF222)/HNH endonuclease